MHVMDSLGYIPEIFINLAQQNIRLLTKKISHRVQVHVFKRLISSKVCFPNVLFLKKKSKQIWSMIVSWPIHAGIHFMILIDRKS